MFDVYLTVQSLYGDRNLILFDFYVDSFYLHFVIFNLCFSDMNFFFCGC